MHKTQGIFALIRSETWAGEHMGRLTNIKPTLKTIGTGIGWLQQDANPITHDQRRAIESPWRRWYNTARWKRLRAAIFLRDTYTCKMCGRLQGDTSKLVCDHVTPHRGKPERFWDETNLQTLCASPCHSKHKQAMEQAQPPGVWD
jgi:5-methylcytosine-specific restriction enzyme A